MELELYVTGSEPERIRKVLSNNITLTGALRGESSVINPSVLVEIDNPSQYNYCFIPEFNRYYFITDMISVRTGLWRIDCAVDVLMSFQAQILNLEVIASDVSSGETKDSTYINGEQWASTVKYKTDVIPFPNSLLGDGEYVLITTGG